MNCDQESAVDKQTKNRKGERERKKKKERERDRVCVVKKEGERERMKMFADNKKWISDNQNEWIIM